MIKAAALALALAAVAACTQAASTTTDGRAPCADEYTADADPRFPDPPDADPVYPSCAGDCLCAPGWYPYRLEGFYVCSSRPDHQPPPAASGVYPLRCGQAEPPDAGP